MVRSALHALSTTLSWIASLNITQFCNISTTDVPLCFADKVRTSVVLAKSTSIQRAKKVPRAPSANSTGWNGSSTVPKGEDLETNPLSDVGENCPFVKP